MARTSVPVIKRNEQYVIGIATKASAQFARPGGLSSLWTKKPMSVYGSQLISHGCKTFDDFFRINPFGGPIGITHTVCIVRSDEQTGRKEVYLTEGTFLPDAQRSATPAEQDSILLQQGPGTSPPPFSAMMETTAAPSLRSALRAANEREEILRSQVQDLHARIAAEAERHEADKARFIDFYQRQSADSLAALRADKDAVIARLDADRAMLAAQSEEKIRSLTEENRTLSSELQLMKAVAKLDEQYSAKLEAAKKEGGLSDGNIFQSLLEIAPTLVQAFLANQKQSPPPQTAVMNAPGFAHTAMQAHTPVPGMAPTSPPGSHQPLPSTPGHFPTVSHPAHVHLED